MKWTRSSVGWFVALTALVSVVVGSVAPAQGYVPTPPGVACLYAVQNNLAVLENSLSPAINAYVQQGTPVTFSGNSGAPVTFAVASSAALLSSPNLDSGLGTLQPGTSTYTFTSTKATATPGVLISWDASFSTATLEGCEGLTPTTYTTQARTFTVVSPPPTAPIIPATATPSPTAPIGRVSKPKVKSLTRAQRLAAALEACRKKGRKRRMICKRQARKQFGADKKGKAKKP
jgi:hypothetical protein